MIYVCGSAEGISKKNHDTFHGTLNDVNETHIYIYTIGKVVMMSQHFELFCRTISAIISI